MKAARQFSASLVGSALLAVSITNALSASNTLLGLWRFNEAGGDTANDASGLHNDGTLVGENGNAPARVPGRPGFGGALQFTNDAMNRAYVAVPGNSALMIGVATNDTWSFACWAYEAGDGAGGFVAYYGRLFTQDGGRGLQWESGASGDAQFYVWNAALPAWQLGLGDTGPVVPVFDQWVHWALVYDGSSLMMYRNGNDPAKGGGVYSVPVTASLNIANYTGALTIGSQINLDPNRNWNGMLDDFAVFRGALSESEVRTIMTGDFSAYLTANSPTILAPPVDQIVNRGLDATFSVTASSQTTLSYQWRFNGADLSGANNSSLTLSNVQSGQAGTYDVRVSNASGNTLSSGAVLTVLEPLPPVLAGLWRFDEGAGTNAMDSSGLTNNGMLTAWADQSGTPGTTLPAWVPGQTGFGTALQFQNDGEYNFVAIAASDSLKIGVSANDTWTIAAWTKELSDGSGGYVARYGRLFAYDDGWGLNFNSGATGDSEYWIWHNDPGVWQQAFGASAPVVPTLDEWVHLALVYDGQSLTLYRNANHSAQGGAKTTLSARGSVAFTDNGGYDGALQIGSVGNEPTDHNWNGLIDDFAVFTGALNESQLATIMSGDFSSFRNTAPQLVSTRSGNQVVISWGFGMLQSTSDPSGNWQDEPTAQSPMILTPAAANQFYRVKR
ncbi:MAG TPA: LamG-like jellyroll fold domain-containing protein [Verrucomicrobiae bacterium]|nr:LamG-like jellyroll fold domain-containing protein [Verrucomicrobiae bacterium]